MVSMEQDERTVRAAYDEVASSYAAYFQETEAEQPIDLAMVEHFARHVAQPRRVLDAGCGAGRMMPLLREYGCDVDGVDLSPRMIAHARTNHGDFEARVGSLLDLPYAASSFDGVFYWYSTIHTPDADLPRLVQEGFRVLRPGGHVLVAFQEGAGVHDVSAAYRGLGHDVTMVRYRRTADQMSAHLAAAGFGESARMVRGAAAGESDAQAVLIAAKAG